MSQSDVTQDLRTVEDQPSNSIMGCAGQDNLDLLTERETTDSLQAVLHHSSMPTDDQTSRIFHLEQALDQALACLNDLRSRLRDQDLLESQLIKTEEFSSAQQQAIASLKEQLQRREDALQQQIVANQSHEKSIRQLKRELKRDFVQLEIPYLSAASGTPVHVDDEEAQQVIQLQQSRIQSLEVEAQLNQQSIQDLEQQLEDAKEDVQELSINLEQAQARLAQVDEQLARTWADLERQGSLNLTLRQVQNVAAERSTEIAALEKKLAIAQIKVEELETQLDKQNKLQAQWQQICQEREAERDYHCDRADSLRKDIDELQEQIVHQSKQNGEFETAIQHWKERYLANQRQIAYLKDLLVESFTDALPTEGDRIVVPPSLIELLQAIQMLDASESTEIVPISLAAAQRFNAQDVPEFLMRRRNFRAR